MPTTYILADLLCLPNVACVKLHPEGHCTKILTIVPGSTRNVVIVPALTFDCTSVVTGIIGFKQKGALR